MIPRLAKVPAPAPLHVAFLAELRVRGFEGQLSLTHADRTVLSTDNSIYQLFPQAIAFPAGTEDLVRIAKAAAEPRFRALKLAPRGGGTGTNGQSLTDGLVVQAEGVAIELALLLVVKCVAGDELDDAIGDGVRRGAG